MLLELDIEGYRSLQSVKWTPESVNVFIGPNASGKSNLLRALQLLSASARGELSETIRREGGFDAILWPGSNAIRFAATFAPLPPYSQSRDDLRYELQLTKVGASRYRVEHEVLANRAEFQLIVRDERGGRIYSIDSQTFQAPLSSIPEEETLLSVASGPLAAGLNSFVTSLRAELADWTVFQGFSTGYDSFVRHPQIARSDSRVDADGSNLVAALHSLCENDPDFEEILNDGMRAALGSEFVKVSFPPAADQRVQLRLWWNGAVKSSTTPDLSDGTLRLLYLIAILANPCRPSLIAIDEPETGLHPTMLRVVADLVRSAASKSQVVLATHSPELLEALGTDEPLPSAAVFERQNGATVLKTLAGEELARWLKRYSLGEIYRTGELEAMG